MNGFELVPGGSAAGSKQVHGVESVTLPVTGGVPSYSITELLVINGRVPYVLDRVTRRKMTRSPSLMTGGKCATAPKLA